MNEQLTITIIPEFMQTVAKLRKMVEQLEKDGHITTKFSEHPDHQMFIERGQIVSEVCISAIAENEKERFVMESLLRETPSSHLDNTVTFMPICPNCNTPLEYLGTSDEGESYKCATCDYTYIRS